VQDLAQAVDEFSVELGIIAPQSLYALPKEWLPIQEQMV
jgi:hypothetical protein